MPDVHEISPCYNFFPDFVFDYQKGTKNRGRITPVVFISTAYNKNLSASPLRGALSQSVPVPCPRVPCSIYSISGILGEGVERVEGAAEAGVKIR